MQRTSTKNGKYYSNAMQRRTYQANSFLAQAERACVRLCLADFPPPPPALCRSPRRTTATAESHQAVIINVNIENKDSHSFSLVFPFSAIIIVVIAANCLLLCFSRLIDHESRYNPTDRIMLKSSSGASSLPFFLIIILSLRTFLFSAFVISECVAKAEKLLPHGCASVRVALVEVHISSRNYIRMRSGFRGGVG